MNIPAAKDLRDSHSFLIRKCTERMSILCIFWSIWIHTVTNHIRVHLQANRDSVLKSQSDYVFLFKVFFNQNTNKKNLCWSGGTFRFGPLHATYGWIFGLLDQINIKTSQFMNFCKTDLVWVSAGYLCRNIVLVFEDDTSQRSSWFLRLISTSFIRRFLFFFLNLWTTF